MSVLQHHVSCLEVAIEESLLLLSRQVLCHQAEVGFQLQLVEVELGGFQEAILEVVEVEEHGVDVESRLGIAVGEIKPAGTSHLDVGQFADGLLQQFLLGKRITASCLASATDGIEQRQRSEIGLQVAQLVVADGKHLGNRQLPFHEMAIQIDECVVFVTTGADAAYDRASVGSRETIVRAVAACTG